MRILVASGIFHPEAGGPATYLYQLLPILQARGHSVSVLSFGDAPSDHDYPYPVTRIPRRNYLARQWAYFRAAQSLWRDHNIAYLHSLGLPLPRSIRPRVAKIVGDVAWERAMNKGWIAPDMDIDVFQGTRCGALVELDKARRAAEARQLDQIIVPSEYLRRMVMGWGVQAERVQVIYNALQGEDQSVVETQAQARAALHWPTGPTLLMPARLTAWKGIDHVLHALARIGNRHIRLVVAGDGPMRAAWEKLAHDLDLTAQTTFTGQMPRHDLARAFRAADYTVVYSGYEGLSHTLLESLHAGTPVIASDKGGNPEVVQHSVNGLLVPYVNVEALAAAIEQTLRAGERERLAMNTQIGLERFRWHQMVDETESLLKKAADERH